MSSPRGAEEFVPNPMSGNCGFCGRATWFALKGAVWAGEWVLGHTDRRPLIAAIYQCGGCERASLATFQTFWVIDHTQSDLLEMVPAARAGRAADLDEDIDMDRMEAWNCFLSSLYRAAIVMARAALQRAVRRLDPDFRGTLKEELDSLESKRLITPQLRQNANELRIMGNDAAHPDTLGSVSKVEAEESLIFLEDFLTQTLVVPKRQKAREQARQDGSDQSSSG